MSWAVLPDLSLLRRDEGVCGEGRRAEGSADITASAHWASLTALLVLSCGTTDFLECHLCPILRHRAEDSAGKA